MTPPRKAKSSIDMTPLTKAKSGRLYTRLTFGLQIFSYAILLVIFLTFNIVWSREPNSFNQWLDSWEVSYKLIVPQILVYVLVISLRAIIDLLSRIEYSRRK